MDKPMTTNPAIDTPGNPQRRKIKMQVKRIDSLEGNVAKFVFEKENAIAEAVLYRYPDYRTRTVICCSTQSGCPVGCRFCGAGDYFVRSLSGQEIVEQVDHCINVTGEDAANMARLQIMFMSMGEPMLNRRGMETALPILHNRYPNAALLISTVGPDVDYEWLMCLSKQIETIGLQFSIHEAFDADRDKLIPFKRKMPLDDITRVGEEWHRRTGRRPFINYCAGPENSSMIHAGELATRFNPSIWEATISVICERNEGLPARNRYQMKLAHDFESLMLQQGFNCRLFDPAGQDDIGGGCGQLWFVQKWMGDHPEMARASIGNGQPQVHTPIPASAAE